jgi:hypothetical protein
MYLEVQHNELKNGLSATTSNVVWVRVKEQQLAHQPLEACFHSIVDEPPMSFQCLKLCC